MKTKPLKVLVCQVILILAISSGTPWAYERAKVAPAPGIESDALSVESDLSKGSTSRKTYPSTGLGSTSQTTGQIPHYSGTRGSYGTYGYAAAHRPYASSNYYQPRQQPVPNPIGQVCSPLATIFPGLGSGQFFCDVAQPRVGCKQIELGARLWYARLNASTVIWGTNLANAPGTALDLHGDLGLGKNEYLYEAEGRCQMRPNWGIRYTFMSYVFEDRRNVSTPGGFWFGYTFFPQFTPILSKWNRYIHRADLVYDWYSQKHAVCSMFAGYSMYDDKLAVSNGLTNVLQARSSTFGLVYGGLSLDRAVRSVGGGVTSLHCKWSVSFLEGYFGWDGTVTGRMHVPMNAGRYGFVEAGWRWIVLRKGETTNTDETNLDGLTVGGGLVF